MIGIGLCGMGCHGKTVFPVLFGGPSSQLAAACMAQKITARLRCLIFARRCFADAVHPIADPQAEAARRRMTFDFQELPI